jgi:DNA-binding transcriptional ArsR family regulator
MTDPEWDDPNILDILGDPLCRRVLVISSKSPVSAATLADRLDVSPPTVYRRINSLVDHGLVQEYRRMDGDGNHYRTFEAALDRVEVAVTQRGYEVNIHRRKDIGDRFDEFWTEFTTGEPQSGSDRSTETDSGTDPSLS